MTGNTTVGGTLGVTGATTAAAIGASNITASGTLGVAGVSTLTGNTTVVGTLGAGATTVASLDSGSGAIVTSGTVTGGSLSDSTATLTGGTLTAATVTVNGALNVNSDGISGNEFSVASSGITTASNVNIASGSATIGTIVNDQLSRVEAKVDAVATFTVGGVALTTAGDGAGTIVAALKAIDASNAKANTAALGDVETRVDVVEANGGNTILSFIKRLFGGS